LGTSMKNLKITAPITLLIMAVAIGAMAEDGAEASATKPTEIAWMSYDAGLAKAKAENKHMFVNFTTSWCGWCKKMNKTTFKEDIILGILADDFVSVKVDGDSKKELDIDGYKITERNLTKSEFKVRSYPTYYFLTPEGGKLGAASGYQNTEQLSKYLTYVAERQYDTTKAQNPGQEKGGK
jgi:thioredoxin-related protein